MKSYLRITLLSGIALLLLAHSAYAVTGSERLASALKTLDSIFVDFEQTVINDENQVIQQSAGQLAMQRPGKFNWTYKTPYEQQIIADGKEIWIYDVALKQATVKSIDQNIGQTPIMVLMNSSNLEQDFQINEIGQKKYLYWVELTPIHENGQFERLYFGLKDNQIMAMDLRDNFGQSTQIVFKQHRYDVIHNPSLFQFNASADTDIYHAE